MLLAINTSTPQFSLALMDAEGILAGEHFSSSNSKNYLSFMPVLHTLFTTSGVKPDDLHVIAAAVGPGGFTGLRVGLAAAKGLCQGLNIPLIGISSLEAMAHQLPFAPIPVCPMISSRKGEVFTALFRWDERRQGFIRLKEDVSLRFEDLPSYMEGKTLFIGNDFAIQGNLLRKTFGTGALLAPSPFWHIRASAVGLLALHKARTQAWDDLSQLVPSYLRPPDIRTK